MTVLLGPLVEVIATDFGLESESQIGNITAIFLIVAGVLAFVWVGLENHLSKRFKSSRRNLLMVSTFIWAAGLFLTSISQNYTQLLTFQIITAIGYAAITPLAFSITMDITSFENRAKAFGLLDVAAMVGSGMGFLISGLTAEIIPWGVPFVLIGSLGLILIGFVMDVKDPKRGIQDRELTEVISGDIEYSFRINKRSISNMIKSKPNLMVLLFNTILYIASGSISYYFIRMMVNDHFFSSSLAVLFFIATFGFQAIGAMFWTKRADKKFSRRDNGKVKVLLESLMIGPGFLIVGYSLMFSINNGITITLFVILIGIGGFLLSGLVAISFSILGEINPPEMRTTIFSMNNLAQTVGRGLGILFMGILFILFDEVYHWGFMIMGGLYVLSIIFVLPLIYSVPRELNRLKVVLRGRAREIQNTPHPNSL